MGGPQIAPARPNVPLKKFIKIGRPGYKVTKQRCPHTGQQSLLFQVSGPNFIDSSATCVSCERTFFLNNKKSRLIIQKSLTVSSRVIDSCQLTNSTLSPQTENGNISFSLLNHTKPLASSFPVEKLTRYFYGRKRARSYWFLRQYLRR